jgi:hypothetical protein
MEIKYNIYKWGRRIKKRYQTPTHKTENNIVLHRYKVVYFTIPKVASSSLKKVCRELLSENEENNYSVHKFSFPFATKDEIYENYQDYFKFAFVRDPWDRLVSCYFNKIHSKNEGVANTLKRYHKFWGGMTFEDFVKNVCEIEDRDANNHFKPQHLFLTDNKERWLPDFVGKLENIDKNLQYIHQKTGIPEFNLHKSNKNNDRSNYHNYYDQELREIVEKKYKKDIELFGYHF